MAVQARIRVVSETRYTATETRRFVLRSDRTGFDYVVYVSPPGKPITAGSMPAGRPIGDGKAPAVYALDGGYGVAGPIQNVLAGAGVMRPAYVVSIDYPPGKGRRDTDFLHHAVAENGQTYGGGGAAFQAFLTEELRPFLEARYPMDPGRAVLLGHSFGGLFAANVLASKPDAFAGYVVASASLWRDPPLLDALAAAAPRGLQRRVLVAAGDKEDARMLEATNRIAAALTAPGSTFVVQKKIFAGENHLSYYPLLTQAAYAWTLPSGAATRIAISIPPTAQDLVAGVYDYPDGRKITVSRKDAKLFAVLTGLPGQAELLAETPRRYFIAGGFDVVFSFEGPADRPATGVMVRMGGQESRAVRAPSH